MLSVFKIVEEKLVTKIYYSVRNLSLFGKILGKFVNLALKQLEL